jgi:hypothetical protein
MYFLGETFDTTSSEWYICSDIPNFEINLYQYQKVSFIVCPTYYKTGKI